MWDKTKNKYLLATAGLPQGDVNLTEKDLEGTINMSYLTKKKWII